MQPMVRFPRMRQSMLLLRDFSQKGSRNLLKMLTGFLQDHCGLRMHLMRIWLHNKRREGRFCNEKEETSLHLLLECEALVYRTLYCLSTRTDQVMEMQLSKLEPKTSSKFRASMGYLQCRYLHNPCKGLDSVRYCAPLKCDHNTTRLWTTLVKVQLYPQIIYVTSRLNWKYG